MTSRDPTTPGDWVSPPSIFSLNSRNRGQIEALNDLSFLSVAFRPILRHPFQLETLGVHGRAITQWRTHAPFGFISTPKCALDKITLRFVSHGSIIRRNPQSDYIGVPGKAMLVAFDEMVSEEASAGFRAFAGTVDRSAIIASHIAFEGNEEQPFPQFQPLVDINSVPMRAFSHNFQLVYRHLHAGLYDGDLTLRLLEEMVLYQFLAAWPKLVYREQGPSIQRPSWHVKRALEYIEANLRQKLTLAEIAAAAHTGVRSLQLSFRRELGKTPVQWILECRLRGAHADLARASSLETTISLIARHWGFANVSDFSRRYRALFGETPQQTRNFRRPNHF